MAKFHMSNCFWSLRLPRSWVGELSVCVWAMPSMFGNPCHLAGNTRPTVSEVGVQCGQDVGVVAAYTVFCLPQPGE